jgi:aminopeptidase N
VLSINRGFSAPGDRRDATDARDLAFLSARDDDPFARYEAMQQLMLDTLKRRSPAGGGPQAVVERCGRRSRRGARSRLRRRAVLLPSESFIGDQLDQVDPEASTAPASARADSASVSRPVARGLCRPRRQPLPIFARRQGRARLAQCALGYIAARALRTPPRSPSASSTRPTT